MKTQAEIKFESIVKEGFHELLKPLLFKKKAYNFYLALETLGQIIQVQKSHYSTKENIHFTINAGIFVPHFWLAYYNFHNKAVPDYPTEPDCFIRKSIGELIQKNDTWYNVHDDSDAQQLIKEMRKNVTDYILPFFKRFNTLDKVLENLNDKDIHTVPLGKLILYAECGFKEKGQAEYEVLLSGKMSAPFKITLLGYGKKYGLKNE